jgi:polyhydroxybutyrate depolymerase
MIGASGRCFVWFTAVLLSAAPLVAGGQSRGVPALASGDHTFSLRSDGRLRSYILHVPRPASTSLARPLILAFHGGGGEADGFKRYAGLDAIADREGVLVAYPNGTGVLPRRLLTWNAGACCGYAMNQHVDDVAFATAVLDDVSRRTSVDARRVYATGHSNGAMMAYRLGTERGERLAAIAPVAGAYSLERFAPLRRLAVLHIHSIDDPRALYGGGSGPPFPGTNVRSSHRPVMEGIQRWRQYNGCASAPRTAETRAGAGPGGERQTATLLVWGDCAIGATVAHWKLTGVGHGWPGAANAASRQAIIGPPTSLLGAAEEVWKFFAPIGR